MAEQTSLDTSAATPTIPAKSIITSEPEVSPAISVPETCASRNCIHKPKSKEAEREEKEIKKKKKSKKEESESESSESDESSSSSDSSESEAADSGSESSSEDEAESRKNKKSKGKKAVKKNKSNKEETRSGRAKSKKGRRVEESDDESSDSSSRDSSVDSSGSEDELTTLKKKLEAQGMLKNASKKKGNLMKDLLKLASRKAADEDAKSSKSKKSERGSKSQKGKTDKKAKEKDVARPKYKRLDEIWDDSLYDYRLRETSDKKKANQWEKYIFTVRRKFDHNNHYQSTVVDIRSTPLRDCLKVIMEGVQGVSLVEKTPRLMPDMLFLYLEELREYLVLLKSAKKKCQDKKAKQTLKVKAKHLETLVEYLDKDYDEMKKTLYPMLANGTITFDLLWALYKPNTLAYSPTYADENQPQVFKINTAYKERDYVRGLFYNIEGKYFDYDGEHFGWAFIDAEVNQFQGARKITSLPCYPLKFHPDQENLKVKLVERGKQFLALAGMNYKLCKGICYVKKDNKVLKANINGRVMVDPKTFRRINPNYPLSDVEARHVEDENLECRCEKADEPRKPKDGDGRLFMITKGDDDKVTDVIEMTSTDERAPERITDLVKRSEAAKLTFTEEEMLAASSVLPGFCFSEKLWVELTISTLADVQWNEGAFDSLVIPDKHKSIVKALVSAHGQHASKSIDDVVSGKGRGLVAVLHGKPGLGKTLTCEAVSDLLKRPLYTVSAGDLGTCATNLEYQLQTILDVAHTWSAVLLLDEADVFLEERSTHDVHRNAMVSIFLRLLEYFQGILFLTTNRVESFDEAFVSRIHLSLRYGDLTIPARKAIWKTFIQKVADSSVPPVSASSSSNAPSEASSVGVPTPDATSSTPNSGTATPVPSAEHSSNSPATPIEAPSNASLPPTDDTSSEKTITLETPATPPTPEKAVASMSATPDTAVEKFTESNYTELARVELNGRQIKNLVKTAQALALYEGVPMGMNHLRRCIEVGRSFEQDLKGGRGFEDVMRSYM